MFEKIRNQIPNIMTFCRIMAIPFYLYFFLHFQLKTASIIFIMASITDALDGFLSRRWKCTTTFGKIADPFADKTLILSASILYVLFINKLFLIVIILEVITIILDATILKKYKISKYPLSIGKTRIALLFILIGLFPFIPTFIINFVLIPVIVILAFFNMLNSVLILFKIKEKFIEKKVKHKKGLLTEFKRNITNIPVEIKEILKELK